MVLYSQTCNSRSGRWSGVPSRNNPHLSSEERKSLSALHTVLLYPDPNSRRFPRECHFHESLSERRKKCSVIGHYIVAASCVFDHTFVNTDQNPCSPQIVLSFWKAHLLS